MGATEHAPRDPLRVLERIYGLAEMVERGGGVLRVTYALTPSPRSRRESKLCDVRDAIDATRVC